MYGLIARRNVLTMILAGGMGERLYPLTRDRAKPAVPFGGRYRIIDFVINNFINSGFLKIKVLTQFKSNSLIEHITRTWRLVPEIGQYVDVVPAQMRKGPFWFRGTADAVFQNLELIFDDRLHLQGWDDDRRTPTQCAPRLGARLRQGDHSGHVPAHEGLRL